MLCTRDQVPDPEATAYVVQAAVMETAKHIAGHRGEPPMPRERAMNALTQLVYRAIFGQDPAEE